MKCAVCEKALQRREEPEGVCDSCLRSQDWEAFKAANEVLPFAGEKK